MKNRKPGEPFQLGNAPFSEKPPKYPTWVKIVIILFIILLIIIVGVVVRKMR